MLEAFEAMLKALEAVLDNGFVECNCGSICDGLCTYAQVKAAIAKAQAIKA